MSINKPIDTSCFKFQFFLDDEIERLQSKRRYSETIGTRDHFYFQSKELILKQKKTSIEKMQKNQDGFQIANFYPKFQNQWHFDSINELFDYSLQEDSGYSTSEQVSCEIKERFEQSLYNKLSLLLNNSTFNQLIFYNFENERKVTNRTFTKIIKYSQKEHSKNKK